VYSLRHPLCNAHMPYCYPWPVQLFHIFSTFSHKRHDFLKKVIEKEKCVLIFSTTFVCNISQSKENWATYDHKCTEVSCRVPIILVTFCETLIFSMDFRKILKYLIHFIKIRPVAAEYFHEDGRTDGLDEVNSHFSQFREYASKFNKPLCLGLYTIKLQRTSYNVAYHHIHYYP